LGGNKKYNLKRDNRYTFQCKKEGIVPFSLSKALDSIVAEEVNQQISSVKTAVKASSTKGRKATKGRSTVKKSTRAAAVESRSLETPQIGGRPPLSHITPAHTLQLPPSLGRTPFITPKFNTRTPLNRTVSRAAKPNEILVSLSGSPVNPLNLRSKVRRIFCL
jgi:hypothetical protein